MERLGQEGGVSVNRIQYDCPNLDILIDFAVSPSLIARGGVEDTRLEAKAKNRKKSEAKDSPSEDRPSRG